MMQRGDIVTVSAVGDFGKLSSDELLQLNRTLAFVVGLG